jgi:hypothetical protein
MWSYGVWFSNNPKNDHNHCEFCMEKFMNRPEYLTEGWHDEIGYRWICADYFAIFDIYFQFKTTPP